MDTADIDALKGPLNEILAAVNGKFVCCDCIDEAFLKDLVYNHMNSLYCTFCGDRSGQEIAAPLGEVVEVIHRLFVRRAEAVKDEPKLPPQSDQDPVRTVELLRSFGTAFGWTRNIGLLSYVARQFESAHKCMWWLDKSAFEEVSIEPTPRERMDIAWLGFAEIVTHKSRFNFLNAPNPYADEFPRPGQVLDEIGKLVKQRGLVTCLAKGERVYRARKRGLTDTWNPDDPVQLGAPPRDKASAGRMNAAGIPHLYVAFEEETALRETVSARAEPAVHVAVGTFETAQPLTVLDLTESVPLRPSEFEDAPAELDPMLHFLAHFASDICLPVSKDGSEHIEYAPTQVVSEYLSQVFEPCDAGSRLDGLMYRSAARYRGKNLVLFPHAAPRGRTDHDPRLYLIDWRIHRLEGRWDFYPPSGDLSSRP